MKLIVLYRRDTAAPLDLRNCRGCGGFKLKPLVPRETTLRSIGWSSDMAALWLRVRSSLWFLHRPNFWRARCCGHHDVIAESATSTATTLTFQPTWPLLSALQFLMISNRAANGGSS